MTNSPLSSAQAETNTFTRNLSIERTAITNEEERLIEVSFSSEVAVKRGGGYGEEWMEILGHKSNEPDLSRINSKAPVLYNHDCYDKQSRIGVVERAWLEAGRGKALLKISKRSEVEGIWRDIKDGVLCNVSVGYRINEKQLITRNDNGIPEYRVTSWTPMEISLVDIPADYSVGVGRTELTNFNNNRSKNMPETTEDKKPQPTTEPKNPPKVEEGTRKIEIDSEVIKTQARNDFIQAETKRRNDIKKIFKPFGDNQRTVLDKCLEDINTTPEQARTLLLNELGKDREPANNPNTRIEVGQTARDKFRVYAQEAFEFRAGLKTAKETADNELRGYSLTELARMSLENSGVRARGLDKRELVGRAFTTSSSDFPIMLANTAHKAMLKGYEEVEEVFEKFTTTGNLSDFKPHDRAGTSGFGDLEKVKEGGKYKYGQIQERKETIKLDTYGKMFCITRQAIINDDMGAFTDIPRKMGKAAKRTIGNKVFEVLTGSHLMADNYQLFNATKHKNHYTGGTASAPSIESIGLMKADMRKHKDSVTKRPLNIRPSYILVPTVLEDKMRVLLTSETDTTQENPKVPNPIRNIAEIITDARLDEASLTAWYMLANPSLYDGIEIGYLDGNSTPFLEEQDGWDVDGIEYKVRIDFGVKALDYRTAFKNDGV